MDRRNFSNMEELTCAIAELIPYDTGGHAINVGEKIKENYKREKAEHILSHLNGYIDDRIHNILSEYSMNRREDY